MYEIKKLEEEWRKYRRKKRLPWMIAVLFIAGSTLFGYYWWQTHVSLNGNTSNVVEKKKVPVALQMHESSVFLDTQIDELATYPKKIVSDNPLPEEISVQPSANKVETTSSKQGLAIEVVDIGKNDKAYEEVAKRFRLGHDTDDSLFLAKAYYLKGNYKKAEYWALQTNTVNPDIEESWLIFVKAKYKQGKRNEAIHILDTYIRKTQSPEGKTLLKKIKKGEI